MIDWPVLSAFVPTFFLVSLTPGLCMTLAMSMGMTQGVGRTLWMMADELAGVGLVAILTVAGVAAVMLHYPAIFAVFKWLGGIYLLYLGVMMWCERSRLAAPEAGGVSLRVPRSQLVTQGFVTAVANPKGWAFYIALLPPFIDSARALTPQLLILVGLILSIEFIALMRYAGGGSIARRVLQRGENVRRLNQVAGDAGHGCRCLARPWLKGSWD